jgi:hypothetical protein
LSTNPIGWTSTLTIFVLASLAAQSATTAQDQHAQMNSRGSMVMGFDRHRTAHHFYLYTDGGAIDVFITDVSDINDLNGIRAHLPHIATMFGHGDFDAPMMVHDTKDVPGTATLARLKDKIRYQYVETPKGGRVDITTNDPEALEAIHTFLTFQIRDHRTGDALTVLTR